MTALLDVYLRDAAIGRLRQRNGRLYFRYCDGWLARRDAIDLSPALPRRRAEFGDRRTRAYFENLLPEADLLAAIARNRGEAPDAVFALLEELAGDCDGAVSLWPLGQRRLVRSAYIPLSRRRLFESVAAGKKQPLLLIAEGLRLTSAGSQDKLPVALGKSGFLLPLGTAASTHILKPPSKRHPHVCLNEFACMQFGRAMGLRVGLARLMQEARGFYLMRRFDRRMTRRGGPPVRLHQIDFCQATSTPPSRKYERDGGPTLATCARVLERQGTQPRRDTLALLGWVICNFVIGNADTHAKNLSLLLGPSGARLAPFYDFLCTAIYRDYPGELALAIGGETDPARVNQRHWRRLSRAIGVSPAVTFRIMKRFVRGSGRAFRKAVASVPHPLAGDERETLRKIEEVVAQRTAMLAACLAGPHGRIAGPSAGEGRRRGRRRGRRTRSRRP